MSTKAPAQHSWDVKHDEVQLAAWKRALVKADGLIEAAAKIVGISRSTGTRLNKKYDLGAFAAKLRLKAGGAARGRQWKLETTDR